MSITGDDTARFVDAEKVDVACGMIILDSEGHFGAL